MLTKKTSKSQITIPKAIIKQLPRTDYFDVSLRNGAVILRPVTVVPESGKLDKIRAKIERLGITEKDVEEAISWARGRR